MLYPKDLSGLKFGRLTVIKKDIENIPKWLCLCNCGNTKSTYRGFLISKKTQSCGCLNLEHRIDMGHKHRIEFGQSAFNTLYTNYRRRAEKINVPFDLSKETFKITTALNCFYCGSEPYQKALKYSNSGFYLYNGIDRIDSSKGYTSNNIVPCCGTCNYAKKSMSQTEFLSWIEKVYKHSVLQNGEV